ncbi:MAG: aminodeoxychorismate/anthranilate synthase component II [Alphaproteobacteria bacterium]|nr:aminodeoxychorismate/anthranilate synthase component II [Alphaproteobacteria bacterium]
MLLVIDNYDSFTYNLVHFVEELGAQTQVVRNDALSAEAALALKPQAICLDLIAKAPKDLPILGVCLGHQAIGQAFGGKVISARAIMHGKLSPVTHTGGGVFKGLPSPFTATRYHSLAVRREDMPADLIVDAETADGEVMGLHHRDRPIFGVQFHPESIASEHGKPLLANFLRTAGIAG